MSIGKPSRMSFELLHGLAGDSVRFFQSPFRKKRRRQESARGDGSRLHLARGGESQRSFSLLARFLRLAQREMRSSHALEGKDLLGLGARLSRDLEASLEALQGSLRIAASALHLAKAALVGAFRLKVVELSRQAERFFQRRHCPLGTPNGNPDGCQVSLIRSLPTPVAKLPSDGQGLLDRV